MSTTRVLLVFIVAVVLIPACKGPVPETATADPAAAGTTGTTATTASFPSIPAPVISGNLPAEVPIPADAPKTAPPEQFRPYFDWFSWQSFIALNWPASSQGRGNPDQPTNPAVFTGMTNTTPVTWGTYKANWELFAQYDKRPTVWDSYDVPYAPAVCPQAAQSDKQLVMSTKTETELDEVNQAFSAPLVDQDSNYVFFEVRYGEWYYNEVRGADDDPGSWLYLLQNLPAGSVVELPPSPQNPANSIMLKAAWRNLTPLSADRRKRYYTVNAWVYDSATGQCTQQPMGLVGFHIATKTPDFPQWVWSTFEQVDNVPPAVDDVPSSFNNGTDTPPTGTQGYANQPPYDPQTPGKLVPNPGPTQVVRLNAIPESPPGASTVDVNNAFHAALPKDSVWQFYQLVITQWPSDPTQFRPIPQRGVYPAGAGAAFPATGAVNTTLETYFQAPGLAGGAFGNSCMSCHYQAGNSLRAFSWGLTRRTHTNAPPPPDSKMKATGK